MEQAIAIERVGRVDRLFAALIFASILAHLVTLGILRARPVREDLSLEDIRSTPIARILDPRLLHAPPKALPKPDAAPVAPRPRPASPRATGPVSAREAVSNTGFIRVLAGLGDSPAGVGARDVLGPGGMGDVAKALEGASKVNVADENTPAPVPGAPGKAQPVGIDALGGDRLPARELSLGAKREVTLRSRVDVEAEPPDDPTLDRDKLAAFIGARMSAVRACYEGPLKRQRSLHGKVRMHFTLMPTGRIAEVGVAEDQMGSREVTLCIAQVMGTWRTPFTPATPAEVDFAFVFMPVQ
jgi:hypothetical protein